MTEMTAWASQSDLLGALALILGTLAIRWRYLGPSGFLLALLSPNFYILAPLLGLGHTILQGDFRIWKSIDPRRTVLLLSGLSLLFVLVYWRNSSALEMGALATLPWFWAIPCCKWHRHNSGGGTFWIPLAILTLIEMLKTPMSVHGHSGHYLITFLTLVAWYRQIPSHLLALSLACAMGCLIYLATQNPVLASFTLVLLLAQLVDKWKWGRGSCPLWYWSMLAAILWISMMALAPSTSLPGWLPMLMILALTFLISQETCRLCLSGARCRETVLSLMSARVPLLFGLGMLGGWGKLDLAWLLLFCLSSESTRWIQLKASTAKDLLNNPCKERWAEGLPQQS